MAATTRRRAEASAHRRVRKPRERGPRARRWHEVRLRAMATEERLTVAPIVGPDDPRRFTDSGIEIEPLVHRADDLPDELELGEPGDFPYTRGVHPEMYRTRPWTMRQYAGYASAHGDQRALQVPARARLDRACRWPSTCRPSSAWTPTTSAASARSAAPASRSTRSTTCGLCFDGIPLDTVSTSMTINAPATVLLALYSLVGEEQGVPTDRAARHDAERHPQGVHRARELHLPARGLDAADDGPVRVLQGVRPDAGTRSRSPAITSARRAARPSRRSRSRCASAIAYVQAALDAGLEVDEFAPRLAFFFNGHNNVFQEVAKFRAARRMWAHIMRDRFGAKDPSAR